jgi:hypothetical protein
MNEQRFRYNYAFLYRSVAVYATTLAAYLLVRGFLIEKEFETILKDPIIYLLSAIIIFSVFAILYNMWLKRDVVITDERITFESRLRCIVIDRSDVRQIRRGVIRSNGFPRSPVITFRLRSRRRPLRVRTYNFERTAELTAALEQWAGELVRHTRKAKGQR